MCCGLHHSEKENIVMMPGLLGISTVCRAGLFFMCEGSPAFLRPHAAQGDLGSSSEEGSTLCLLTSTQERCLMNTWGFSGKGSCPSLGLWRQQRPVTTTGFGRIIFPRMEGVILKGDQHDGAMKITDFS